MALSFAAHTDNARPIYFVTKDFADDTSLNALPHVAAYAAALGYTGAPGSLLLVPDTKGGLAGALFGRAAPGGTSDPFQAGTLASSLPAGDWFIANPGKDESLTALAFLLHSYAFTAYKPSDAAKPRLVAPKGVDAPRLEAIANAIFMGRDLINTPTNDLGPDALEAKACLLAQKFGISPNVVRGPDLLAQNFPLIHAVGKASAEAPRILDFTFGPSDAPKVTLVGKGVCFDTGGLDIKPGGAMLLMKKDMGGAAVALSLAAMVMEANLPIRLRVILPIVENAISSNAFRPGDIYPSRKGLTVEIGNTDAEGRLILADALALADEEAPDLLFDFATLTGAARVALGPDLPPFYTMDEVLAADIATHAAEVNDPVWRMPLWEAYDKLLDGKISNLNNAPSGPFAGSITAALFLRRFVTNTKSWVHFDVYGWNPSTKPGRPEGGEIQAARLLFALLAKRYTA